MPMLHTTSDAASTAASTLLKMGSSWGGGGGGGECSSEEWSVESGEGVSTNVENVHVSESLLMLGSSVNGESTQRGVSPSSVVLLVDLVLYCTL